MTTELTYRLYDQPDIPGLLRLWEQNTSWGALTPEQWQQWYVDTPHGPCLIPVGVDGSGGIRAQCVSTPAVLSRGDRRLKAYRMTAPILDREFRAACASHPVARLYATTKEQASAEGYTLLYALPSSTLKSFLRKYLPTLQLQSLGCVSTPLPTWAGHRQRDLTIDKLGNFGPDFDALWFEAKERFPLPIAIVRSSEWLRYRYGGKLALGVRNPNNVLLGYAVFDDRTGLLLDCLARTRDDLASILEGSLLWLATHRADLLEIKAMNTPFLADLLRDLGFRLSDFEFFVGREVLGTELSLSSFPLERWHLMPGD